MKFITNTSDLSKYLSIPFKENSVIKSISTDTRSIKKDSMFIAIRGKNFDGNDFVDEALEKGAVIILADHKRYQEKKNKKLSMLKIQFKLLKKSLKTLLRSLKEM